MGRLHFIGWAALLLGSLHALRLFPLDWPGIAASWWCGWAILRRKPSFLLATAIAGGIVLADSLLSMVLMGPLLFREPGCFRPWWMSDNSSFVKLHLMHDAIQSAFWPWAAASALRNYSVLKVKGAYAVHARDTVIGAFCVSGWISLVIQLWAKTLVFRLV